MGLDAHRDGVDGILTYVSYTLLGPAFEAEMMALTGATEDHANAVASFVAKEKPTFEGR